MSTSGEASPKFDTKSDIKYDISIKPTTWIGHVRGAFYIHEIVPLPLIKIQI